jgi:hypothetical protein
VRSIRPSFPEVADHRLFTQQFSDHGSACRRLRYIFNRDSFTHGDDPILAAIARGEPFRVETPKTKTQLFSPVPAKQFFGDMTSSCKPS